MTTAGQNWPVSGSDAEDQPHDVIDDARLELLHELDPDGTAALQQAVITAFLREAPTRLSALRAAVAAGGGHPLEQAAHQLKGSAANLGATRVWRLCGRVEALARSGAEPDDALVDQLQMELDRAVRVLTDALSRSA